MTADEIWNEIVSKFYEKTSALEREVQELWENFFSDAEFFGYSKLRGEIDSQRNIQIGSGMRTVPDILIKDCSTGKDLFVVELKQHNLPFDEKFKVQLFSYMRQCLLKVGILICNKIYIFYGNDDNAIHTEIPFEHGNPQGSKFIDLFRKGNFDENAVKAFIEQQQTLQSDIQAIRADVQRVSIKDIIKQYYKPQYSEEAIELALKDLRVSVSFDTQKQAFPEHKFNPPILVAGEKDKTQYIFKGSKYGKRQLVLAVVSDYARSHPAITRDELKNIFPKKLEGSHGVVEDVEEAPKQCKDYLKRFITKQPIQLSDGAMYVCGEWKIGNIGKFIAAAKELGYDITET